ncbi:MAG: VRR-NUC domain-containing protein, partial [Rhodospirillaceae bacterium]
PPLEKVEQANISNLLRTLGFSIYTLGHPSPSDGRRHRGTMQTPGLPDLLVFSPPPKSRLIAIEVKREGGRLRPAQVVFRQECRAAGVDHVVGTYNAVVAWLIDHRYLRGEQVPWYRRPDGADATN